MPTCSQPGCPVLVAKGRCPLHQRAKEQARYNVEARRWYSTARWHRLRAQVLAEDPCCRECKPQGRVTASTDVDHVIPHRGDARLFWMRSNLQGLCATCHSRKTQRGE